MARKLWGYHPVDDDQQIGQLMSSYSRRLVLMTSQLDQLSELICRH